MNTLKVGKMSESNMIQAFQKRRLGLLLDFLFFCGKRAKTASVNPSICIQTIS